MKKYIALLRGINISGKNKIPMVELKSCLTELGYTDVFIYLNSGNIVFSTDESIETALADKIKGMIQERFGLDIPVFVIPQEAIYGYKEKHLIPKNVELTFANFDVFFTQREELIVAKLKEELL